MKHQNKRLLHCVKTQYTIITTSKFLCYFAEYVRQSLFISIALQTTLKHLSWVTDKQGTYTAKCGSY
jgi:hypothetical protein